MSDIKRICIADPETNTTEQLEEDKQWFPNLVGKNWVEEIHKAMRGFKDESFINQYLSPKVIRDLQLFSALDDEENEEGYVIDAIHDEEGYELIRKNLSSQYRLADNDPDIQIFNVDLSGSRTLMLVHNIKDGKPLGESTNDVLKHIHNLWGYPVELHHIEHGELKGTDLFAPD